MDLDFIAVEFVNMTLMAFVFIAICLVIFKRTLLIRMNLGIIIFLYIYFLGLFVFIEDYEYVGFLLVSFGLIYFSVFNGHKNKKVSLILNKRDDYNLLLGNNSFCHKNCVISDEPVDNRIIKYSSYTMKDIPLLFLLFIALGITFYVFMGILFTMI